MSDHELVETAPTLCPAEREALVLGYWRRGALTPLALANSLARPPLAAQQQARQNRA